MSKVFIVSAKRTPIGSFLGSLSTVHPAQFGSDVVKAILQETKVPANDLDEVIVGNILPAGLGQGIARQVSIHAGIPAEVPAYTVNMVCGSGMKTIMNAYTSIKAGFHHLVIAGGTESMSKAPYIIPDKARSGLKFGQFTVKDHMIDDALMDVFNNYHMGITAENIVDLYKLSREQQDQFAIASQEKAIAAVDAGKFKDEIVPVEVKLRRETILFDTDEYPNRRTNLEKLGHLRPAFKKDGSVTAGNASGINDGASFMLVASEEAVDKYNLKPLVEIVGIGQGGVDPSIMGMGPVPAIRHALQSTGLALKDIDLLELNEAFAAQSLGVVIELSKEHQVSVDDIMARTNVNGGAIALGHPVGASGNRIATTLIHEMIKQKSTYGLASLCIGGGMGTAIIVKRVEE
ncbi:acetyl-CoA C-acetyltransferase [Candidatus Xianfuyuplasma coldseepsis]|uniref:acetyl-CoA C-acetyltransferase n=1 Tax=Candidatus Xianfuyuplasma coldseepsis TaxID=2782163 RepID=A0A7L7KTM6_9MOLU|nr:acetyl-CoA C-acetyltransferase [Xianfuyuplasma coldseepsis]QMS85985.1 acetyl-CoA C-acetyltransferase [Xianfuyuplasma coldseepsis]